MATTQISDYINISNVASSLYASDPVQLDNLKIDGVRQGAVDFFGNVLYDLYKNLNGNANSSTFLNVINQFNDIVHADNLRTLGMDGIDTTKYQSSDTLQKKQGVYVNLMDVQTATGVVPNNINSANGIFIKSYEPLIYEKTFLANNYTSNSILVTNYINSTLNTNNTYANAGVTTALQYAINNGYTSSWSTLNSASFDTSAISQEIQDSAEIQDSIAKSKFLENNFLA